MVEEAKAVGREASEKLKAQTQQLQNIDNDIKTIESNLKRADALVRAFMRRMMTDKLILVFLGLIVLAIVIIVIYSAVNPKGAEDAGVKVPDKFIPPVPSG